MISPPICLDGARCCPITRTRRLTGYLSSRKEAMDDLFPQGITATRCQYNHEPSIPDQQRFVVRGGMDGQTLYPPGNAPSGIPRFSQTGNAVYPNLVLSLSQVQVKTLHLTRYENRLAEEVARAVPTAIRAVLELLDLNDGETDLQESRIQYSRCHTDSHISDRKPDPECPLWCTFMKTTIGLAGNS